MQFAIVIVRVAIDVVQINVGSMVEFILFIIIEDSVDCCIGMNNIISCRSF